MIQALLAVALLRQHTADFVSPAAVTEPGASPAAVPTTKPILIDKVDWPVFLSRHDLTWSWVWGQGAKYTLQPRSLDISRCGKGGINGSCCVQTNVTASTAVVLLAGCDPAVEAQQWQLLESGQYRSGDGRCLQDGHKFKGAMLGPCASTSSDPESDDLASQKWKSIDGYLYVPTTQNCLQVLTPSTFCTDTVCPSDRATPFQAGMALGTSPANNGDRSQLFAAYTLPTATSAQARENFIPLTWTTSAVSECFPVRYTP